MRRPALYALFSLLMLLSLSSSAQLYVAGSLFNNSYGGGYNQSHAGLQGRIGYEYKEGKMGIALGYNLSPMKGNLFFPADYYDASGNSVSLGYKGTVGMQNAFMHEYYRFGAAENKFHIRSVTGISVDFININFAPTTVVPEGYKTDMDVKSTSAIGIKIDLGVTADYRINDKSEVFGEFLLSLPANQIQGQYYDNPTVNHKGILFGMRYYFGQRDYIW